LSEGTSALIVPPPATKLAPVLLIVTWNVNSLRARLPRVLEFLALHRPDVACLQETKCAPDQFPTAELAAAGYRASHHSAGPWAGVALLAREPLALSDPSAGLPGEPAADEARWCEATIGGIRLVSAYVPNGRTLDSPEFPRKLEFLEAAARRTEELGGDGPMVLCGDMNIAPADADVYDPAAFAGGTHVTAQERARLAAILDTGLIDAYRQLHPDEPQFTWWDYRAGHFHKGFGLRIDLALVSRELADRVLSCGIDRNFRKGQKPSDHAPLLLELS
jgi:exodeoxyribonuclease-3